MHAHGLTQSNWYESRPGRQALPQPRDATGAGAHVGVRQVKVGQQRVAGVVQQDVLRLQVAVHKALQVQVLQRQQHLRRRPGD